METEKSNGPALTDFMKTAFRETLDFVPFQMRNKNPKAFLNRIQQQTHVIANQHTIILQNIGTPAMFYLSDYIQSVDGVIDIMPAKTVETNGNYRVLVFKDDFRRVRKILMSNIPEWFDLHVELDARPPEDAFPGPPRVAPISDDGYSSGEDTYMNLSINTALSYDGSTMSDNDSYTRSESATSFSSRQSFAGIPHSVPQSRKTMSWASRASQTRAPPPQSTNFDSQCTQHTGLSPPLWDATSELASSRAEVDKLRNHFNEMTNAFAKEKQELLSNFAAEKEELIRAMKEEMSKSICEQMQQYCHQQRYQ